MVHAGGWWIFIIIPISQCSPRRYPYPSGQHPPRPRRQHRRSIRDIRAPAVREPAVRPRHRGVASNHPAGVRASDTADQTAAAETGRAAGPADCHRLGFDCCKYISLTTCFQ